MTPRQLAACRRRLEAFVGELLASLRYAKQRHGAQVYMRGLLLEGRRKSCQPMAERLPDGDEQSLQQFVNQSPWGWTAMRAAIAQKMTLALSAAEGAALGDCGAWILDDTGFPKQGRHSVGVARQYCPPLGKRANCQVGVSVSYATARGAMPLNWRLYLPEEWLEDPARRAQAGIPAESVFQTKWQLALEMIDELRGWQAPAAAVVVADAGYGTVTEFRDALTQRGLCYVVQIKSDVGVWTEPVRRASAAPRAAAGGRGRPAGPNYRHAPAPQSVREVALALPKQAWRTISWREGSKGKLTSRFAALRVQPSHGYWHNRPEQPLVWLLIEWPADEPAPTKYWLSNLPEATSRRTLVQWAKARWWIELNYREMKDHLGLDHFEGRGYAGWHHHVTLVMLAFAFLLAERLRQGKKGRCRPFPKSWAGSSACSPPGAASASSAASAFRYTHDNLSPLAHATI